jgi:fatty-acyl-CoA synthase
MSAWSPRRLADFLDDNAATRGEDDALVTDNERVTHAALRQDARAVARSLLALGIRHGDHVGLLTGNDADWVRAFYGAALIGAVTVPVNTRFKAGEIAFALRQADCRAVILRERFLKLDFAAMLLEAEPALATGLPGAELPLLRHAVIIGEGVPAGGIAWRDFLSRQVEDAGLDAAMAAVTQDEPLLIQFTSGTTAYPKGVLLTHQNMLRNAWSVSQRLGVRRDDRYLNCRPFFHVAGSTLSLLVCLVTGAAMVTPPTFEAGAALRLLDTERCTLISGNDSIFQMLMAHPDFDAQKLHLRGGWAAAGPVTMRRVMETMGARELCWAYGLSEASPNVVLSDHRDPAEARIAGRAKPHDGVQVRIVDPATGAVLPAGRSGEIQVRGWSVMRGYHNNPDATAKTFTADGWLRTGDLGSLDADGRLGMEGRLKDVLRVGGENVAPAEVEEALLAHPAIAQAQVVGVPDARLGEVPAAFVTLRAGAAVNEAELLAWLKPRLANFRMPRHLRIVADFEAIGTTASGKVQKAKLREHAARIFAGDAPTLTSRRPAFGSPRNRGGGN